MKFGFLNRNKVETASESGPTTTPLDTFNMEEYLNILKYIEQLEGELQGLDTGTRDLRN
jgi:hypothetical protein